jgi:hypothetical protein
MKLVIFGSRNFQNLPLLTRIVEGTKSFQSNDITEVICGGAAGADTLGAIWAMQNKIEIIWKYADWDQFGKSAGHIRNVEMRDIADLAIGFWDNKSPGTSDMINLCLEKGIPLLVYNTYLHTISIRIRKVGSSGWITIPDMYYSSHILGAQE